MKKKWQRRFPITQFYHVPLVLLFVVIAVSGCKKSSQPDPCEGVLNEGMPTRAALIFVDGQTGENILLSKNIDTSAITITPAPADLRRGVIAKQPGSPINGALVIPVTDTKEGVFEYKISIANVGSFTLSHTNKKEKSDNKCKPYYIKLTDPQIADHPFTVSQNAFQLLFKITL